MNPVVSDADFDLDVIKPGMIVEEFKVLPKTPGPPPTCISPFTVSRMTLPENRSVIRIVAKSKRRPVCVRATSAPSIGALLSVTGLAGFIV